MIPLPERQFGRCRHCGADIMQVEFLNGHSVWLHLDGARAHRYCDPQPKLAEPDLADLIRRSSEPESARN